MGATLGIYRARDKSSDAAKGTDAAKHERNWRRRNAVAIGAGAAASIAAAIAAGYMDFLDVDGNGSIGDVDGDGLGDLLLRGALDVADDGTETASLFLFLGGDL